MKNVSSSNAGTVNNPVVVVQAVAVGIAIETEIAIRTANKAHKAAETGIKTKIDKIRIADPALQAARKIAMPVVALVVVVDKVAVLQAHKTEAARAAVKAELHLSS
jgi:hypothetical protein